MEFVSPMKSILQQYQILNAELQAGLLVIIYRSLSRDQQQSILAQLIKLESECHEEGLTESIDPSFTSKILKACHCLMRENKLNLMERFVDSIIDNSPLLQRMSCILEDDESRDIVQESEDALGLMEETEEPASNILPTVDLPEIVPNELEITEEPVQKEPPKYDVTDEDIKQFANRELCDVTMNKHSLPVSCEPGSTENKEKGLKTRKRKYSKGNPMLSNKCEPCGYVFSNRFSLYRHMVKHEEKQQGVFCNYCKRNNWFKTTEDMVQHQKKNHPYITKCSQCSMSFVSEATLAKHELSHSRQSRYVLCNFCGDAFTQTSNAKYHIRVHHTDANPYKCRICKRRYPDPQGLYHHEKMVHPEKKPYACVLCEESFVSVSERQKHWSEHDIRTVLVTGESPSVLKDDLEDQFWNETEMSE